jgi:hypothetical protein
LAAENGSWPNNWQTKPTWNLNKNGEKNRFDQIVRRRCDIQYNDIRHNGTQNNTKALIIKTFCIQCRYTEFLMLCWMRHSKLCVHCWYAGCCYAECH